MLNLWFLGNWLV